MEVGGLVLRLRFLQVYHRCRLYCNAWYVTTAKTLADARATKINVLKRSSGFNATPRKRAFLSILLSTTPVVITENPIPAQTAMNSAILPPTLFALYLHGGPDAINNKG
jgi:hypothetical protein